MKLSTKGRYGMKAMIDLAVYADAQYVSLKSIAERQNLSEMYLEQLIAPLRKSGLVKSLRGASGGYTLGKPSETIKLSEIIRTLEGSYAPVSCVDHTDKSKDCNDDCQICASKQVFHKIYDAVHETLETITLSELADDYKKLLQEHNISTT